MLTIYEVLRRPLITEKSNYQSSDLHQYAFEVAIEASKIQVKDAIETLFDGVKVMRVNIVNVPAKRKRNLRNRRMISRRNAYKKAIVTLAPGSKTIPAFEGVK